MRFKSIFGAFIFISMACLIASVIFVQTKTFGVLLTKVITDISRRQADATVSIKSISISVFPPGIELNQVKVKKDFSEGKKLQAELGQLGFYIGLVELEEQKLTLGEIRVSDSAIDYFDPTKDEEDLKEIDTKVIDKVFDLSNHQPIRIDTILFQNTKLTLNHELIDAKRIKIFKRGKSFMARFHLSNLVPLEDNPFSIDEIWGDAEIERRNVNIHRLRIQQDVHTLLIKGKIKNYHLLKNASASVSGESSIYLKNIVNEYALPEMVKIDDGSLHLSFNANWEKQQIDGKVELALANFRSNFINAEKLIASAKLSRHSISLDKMYLENAKERIKLLSPAEVFNLKTKHILTQPIKANVEQLDLNNALRILPSLSVLKGELNGNISFRYQNKDLYFTPENGFIVNNLGLIVGKEKPFEILMIKRAKLTSGRFKVINNEFQMDSVVELNHSLLDVHGYVNKNRVDFKVNDAVIDLEDFGNISQLDIKGKGNLDIDVSGPLDGTVIKLKGKTDGFEVLGYRLGKADKDISIDLKDSSVLINHFEAKFRSSPISGTGVINYGNSDIALGINSPKAYLGDLQEILHPIFSKLTFLPKDLDLNAKIDANIYGKTSLAGLKLKAEVQFADLTVFGESISSGEFTVGLNNQLLTLNGLSANKGRGQIRGDFQYHLASEQMKLGYEWEELALSGFSFAKKLKLNLNGLLSGTFYGEGTSKNYLMKLEGKMDETKSPDYTFPDSKFDIKLTPEKISGSLNFLGEVLQSKFDYYLVAHQTSSLRLDLNVSELKPFTTALFGQHLENENFSGNIHLGVESQFKKNFEQFDLKGTLRSLQFKHENFNVNYQSNETQFLVENNRIRRWNLNIQEPDLNIETKGEGVFSNHVVLTNNVNFNSRIFELLIAPVLSAEGFIKNMVKVEGKGDNYDLTVFSKANNLNLTIESMPFPLNNLSYGIEYSDKRLVVQELKTTLENGSVLLKGDVFFDDTSPDINMKYVLDRAEIPILGKSVINITGEGIILGNEPPYNVTGEILLNKAQIINEITDFSSKSNALSQIRFLPPNQESIFGKLINLNVNVKAETPARISNSLMDVSLKGEVRILGNPSRLRGEGHLFAPPNTSRIFFKNSEYFLTNADLNFSPKKDISNPDFDVQAMTFISSYKVYPKAYGDLERFNFELTSDPSLPRNSILSLIAFGYTDEIQNSLRPEDRQSLTQVGVGSFVFDRFKISDILNKQFGLQVNLGTVLEQSQTDSLISGRATESQGTLGRTRSATKIELKKRLDEALSLSVSSTMGGSIGQRQSMNLNYSVRKNVQVEGIYELRTAAEGEEDIIDNSIGADLKLRWTFK